MNQLVHFENAKRELQLATNVDEVKDLRDKAEALRLYMKQAGESLQMQNQCAEIKVRAERKAGELLKVTEKARGGQPYQSTGRILKPVEPTLSDIGISKSQSSRWQAIADIPEPVAIEEEVGLRKYNLAEQADDSRSDNPPSCGVPIGGDPRFMGVR